MKTVITKEDVEKAINRGGGIGVCQSCVLHQAIKRATGKYVHVWINEISLNGSGRNTIPLTGHAARITEAGQSEWPSFIGTEIDIPELT